MVTWNRTAWVVLQPGNGIPPFFRWKSHRLEKNTMDFLAARVSEVSNQLWVWFATFQLLRHRSILESDYGRGRGLSDVGVGQVGLSLSDECLRRFENFIEFQCCRLANYPHFLQTLSLTEIISIICRCGSCPTSRGIQMGQPSPVLFRRIIG